MTGNTDFSSEEMQRYIEAQKKSSKKHWRV